MKYYCGIDIGSGTSKCVILQDDKIIVSHVIRSGTNYRQAAHNLRMETLAIGKIKVSDIAFTVATGQGSNNVEHADSQVTDIRCVARGINFIFPEVRTVIDVEGQSTQVILVNSQGQVIDFVISEKCASGAGRFLDIISNVLQVPITEIGEIALKSKSPVVFTTACAVFGESEAVSRVAEGVSKEDILAGVLKALAGKIVSLVERVKLEPKCAMCGGGALNPGLIYWVQKLLGTELLTPEQPQFVTALGAAILARETAEKKGNN